MCKTYDAVYVGNLGSKSRESAYLKRGLIYKVSIRCPLTRFGSYSVIVNVDGDEKHVSYSDPESMRKDWRVFRDIPGKKKKEKPYDHRDIEDHA